MQNYDRNRLVSTYMYIAFTCTITWYTCMYMNKSRIIFERVKCHLEHQVQHKSGTCKCSEFKPLHMYSCRAAVEAGAASEAGEIEQMNNASKKKLLQKASFPTGG